MMRTLVLWCALVAAAGCKVDADADGARKSADCDDHDGQINPDARETCNGIDDNCNGSVDEDPSDGTLAFVDVDNDGHGDALTAGVSFCEIPAGFVENDNTDCDDDDARVLPGGSEICNGEDDNCNKVIDEGVGTDTFFRDDDGDGYGETSDLITACVPPDGYVDQPGDCNDDIADVHPGAFEDCNGVDDDCDGAIDEDAGSTTVYHPDRDGDGFGNDLVSVEACVPPDGFVEAGGDCDDTDAAFHPGAPETDCTDLNDYNCDGSVGFDDLDADGFSACTDCNDTIDTVNPGANEFCNGTDDDCNTIIDDNALDSLTFFADSDADTFGNAASTTSACTAPPGFVADSTDCDDAQSTVHPGASEVCDSLDNDCDGTTDVGAIDGTTLFPDADGDTYGETGGGESVCPGTTGYVADSADCDDTNASVNPAATEVCDNGVDDNCDASSSPCGLSGDLGPADGELAASESSEALLGYRVGTADLDADGMADVLSGAPSDSSYAGKVYIAYGPAPDDGSTAIELSGSAANDFLGYDVSGLGDLDGDGFEDAALAAPFAGSGAGSTILVYGSATRLSSGDVSSLPHLDGDTTSDTVGPARPAGDVYGDGFADLMIGAITASDGFASGGSVYLLDGDGSRYSGANVALDEADAVFTGFDLFSLVGDPGSFGAGDLDGDGLSDIALGAWETNLYAGPFTAGGYLFYSDSAPSGTVSVEDGDAVFTIATSTARRVSAESGADFDGDGFEDLAFAVEGISSAEFAEVFLYYGSSTQFTGASDFTLAEGRLVGSTSDDAFSLSFGDLDNDGLADLSIGSPLYDGVLTDAGHVAVFPGDRYTGTFALTSASLEIIGDTTESYLGTSVEGAGDVDGDGVGDLVVGAPEGTFSGNGKLYIFFGTGI